MNWFNRLMEWDRKRRDKMWHKHWDPFIEEEVDIALAMDGKRYRLHKLKDNIEWEEKDGL